MGKRSSESFEGEMKFVTEDGRHVSFTKSMPKEIVEKFRSGEDVYVEYLPEDPNQARWKDQGSDAGALLLLGFGCMLFGAGWWFWVNKMSRD